MIDIVRNSYIAHLKNGAILRLSKSQRFEPGMFNYNISALYYYWHLKNRKSIIPVSENVGHTYGPGNYE